MCQIYELAAHNRSFIPPDDKLVQEERFTYDMNVHGTGGPITLAYPTLRGGYDTIVQDTLEESFGFPRVLEPVCLSRLYQYT